MQLEEMPRDEVQRVRDTSGNYWLLIPKGKFDGLLERLVSGAVAGILNEGQRVLNEGHGHKGNLIGVKL